MNRFYTYLIISILGLVSGLVYADTASEISRSIVGVWGESHNNGESFWSIYNFMSDGTIHTRLVLPYVDSVIHYAGNYKFDGNKNCVTVKISSHQEIISEGKHYCFDIIEIKDDYLVHQIDKNEKIIYKVNDSVSLVNDIPSSKANLIEQLLNTSGKLDAIESILIRWVHDMIISFQASNKDIPSHVVEKIETRTISLVKKEMRHNGKLLKAISIIYHKYFTYYEIEQLIQFYDTPAGRKFGGLTNTFAEELSMATKLWSKNLQPSVIDQMQMIIQSEGYSFR